MGWRLIALLTLTLSAATGRAWDSKKQPDPSALDVYVREALSRGAQQPAGTPGSLYTPNSPLLDFGRDLRARSVDDIVTILVAEKASAVASGTTKSQRQSSVKASISSLAGPKAAAGGLSKLAETSADTNLNGVATTSRETVLSTTLTARVTHVLPNGNLVVEGTKELVVNSERQVITVRGVARVFDLTSTNVVRSDRLAQMEIRINGKGVVGDAIRRPFFLYRLLLGLIPF